MSGAGTGARVRAEAAAVVDAVVTLGRSLDDALAEAEVRVRAHDRPLLRQLAYGTLRRHFRLRFWASRLIDRPLKRRDSVIESLVAVGLFQLAESRVPDHAAVSLTVDAARQLRRPKYAPLINAVLRNFRRQHIADSEPPDNEVRYDHPAWLIRRLQDDWPDRWREILAANDERAPMWLRVNRRKTTLESYLGKLAESGAASGEDSTLPGFDQAIRLAAPRPVSELPGFDAGLVSVQDAAAQLAAPWLLAGGGLNILDACSAPGGKTGHLLELAGDAAALTALDISADRLEATAANLSRLGLEATLKAADASIPESWWDGRLYDRILLDAPCSGTGVIRRHPDIKLLRRESDVDDLARLQEKLLDALWPLLAPGGRLLYATCSVLARENDEVVAQFLGKRRDASEDKMLPDYNIRDVMYPKQSGFQVFPGNRGLDGFYYACLVKQG
jgi:16S rRNA (cytosine967-C5)-methyltransferase